MDRDIFIKKIIAFGVNNVIRDHQAQLFFNNYFDKLDISDSIVQHIGPEYYAYQILINEKLVDFVAL